MERPQPPEPVRADQVAAVPRARARHDGNAGAADQLPSVPPRTLLFVHNGFIDEYPRLRRDLLLAVGPRPARRHRGHDRFGAAVLPRPALGPGGRAAAGAGAHGPVRRGNRPWPRSRRAAADDPRRQRRGAPARGPIHERAGRTPHAPRQQRRGGRPASLYPENERLQHVSEEARAVVSEPLANLPGLWPEVPPSTALIVQPGADEQLAFTPRLTS